MKTHKQRAEKFSISTSPRVREWLIAEASRNEGTISEVVRKLVLAEIENREKKATIESISDYFSGTNPRVSEQRASYVEAKRPVLSKHQARKSQK
jgi:hypothetical protein